MRNNKLDKQDNKNIKKTAFTLAEVLVTLGIVGVVAMLTVPAMVKNYRFKIYGSSLKKVYSQITDAAQAIMNDEHSTNFYQTTAGVPNKCKTDTDSFEKGACYFLRNYFKSAADCQATADVAATKNPKCVGSSYITKNGEDAGNLYGQHCILTINGATICMTYHAESPADITNGVAFIVIDVNGPDEPNMIGIDTFGAKIKPDGTVVDWSNDEEKCNTRAMSDGHIGDWTQGCLTKVMKNGWKISE
ncbi:prepilin-type N-terminal cleavage/methylation domain-containing protein [bacterium]|nr:prepilin-type N-terminal cleavage/methylation domain-containing protein [bacterium]